jgi:NYN domain-containing protein
MRQCAAWEKAGAKVIPRPLRYPRDWPTSRAEEKGIDVQIAIDMVTMAINGELDVAILATTDTDLRPALEAFHVLPLDPAPSIEVAAWRSPTMSKKLQVPGIHVWVHFVERAQYMSVRDGTDYNIA